MKVLYLAGNRSSIEEMNYEAKDAVAEAISQVQGKTGFKTLHETWRNCTLEVCIGHNIYTTSIEIRPNEKELAKRNNYHNGSAYFCNGTFWACLSRTKVELI
nr:MULTISPECIES: hypothetical protein [unclassified Dysgonomonas]